MRRDSFMLPRKRETRLKFLNDELENSCPSAFGLFEGGESVRVYLRFDVEFEVR